MRICDIPARTLGVEICCNVWEWPCPAFIDPITSHTKTTLDSRKSKKQPHFIRIPGTTDHNRTTMTLKQLCSKLKGDSNFANFSATSLVGGYGR